MRDPKYPNSPHCFAVEPEEYIPDHDGLDVCDLLACKITQMMPAVHAAIDYAGRNGPGVRDYALGEGGVPGLCAGLRASFLMMRNLLASVRAAHQLHGDKS